MTSLERSGPSLHSIIEFSFPSMRIHVTFLGMLIQRLHNDFWTKLGTLL
jgi:hypothetical protein